LDKIENRQSFKEEEVKQKPKTNKLKKPLSDSDDSDSEPESDLVIDSCYSQTITEESIHEGNFRFFYFYHSSEKKKHYD